LQLALLALTRFGLAAYPAAAAPAGHENARAHCRRIGSGDTLRSPTPLAYAIRYLFNVCAHPMCSNRAIIAVPAALWWCAASALRNTSKDPAGGGATVRDARQFRFHSDVRDRP
jgi:hypothetical protein